MGKRTKDNTITVRGRIDAVFYAGPRFSAGRLETQSGDEIVLVA
jgi:exodeoxyribonuclease V alpha subunit